MNSETLPPVFTIEERDQNEARKYDFFEIVASNEALVVVGAGSSAFVGYDIWSKLLDNLENLAYECGNGLSDKENTRMNSPLEYAQKIKQHIWEKTGNLDEYYKFLYKSYGPRTPQFNDFHRKLIRLPFKGILTTNYDTVLEAALGEIQPQNAHDNSLVIDKDSAQRISEFLLSLDFDRYPKRIAHLHGRYDRPKSIILSLDDYISVYGLKPSNSESRLKETIPSWSLHRKLLWSILATRRVVFIGFSMDDPYFVGMLDFVSGDLWRWDESIHFAVMSISREDFDYSKNKAKDLKRRYGLETVFYENIDESHLGLQHIISEAARECGTDHTTDWLEMVNLQMEDKIKVDENKS